MFCCYGSAIYNDYLSVAAKQGCVFAKTFLIGHQSVLGPEIDECVAASEPNALYHKGRLTSNPGGIPLIKRAAELGYIPAMHLYCHLAWHEDDPRYVRALYYCANRGYKVDATSAVITTYIARWAIGQSSHNSDVVYMICYLLEQSKTKIPLVFMSEHNWVVAHAKGYYNGRTALIRASIRAWSLCGIHLGVSKDMRVFISRLVWASRWYSAGDPSKTLN